MDEKSLRKLQLIELGALLEVKRICEKHHIQYILTGGSLLGAVRHHGFIPWDDDIDIGMLRDDYERFVSVCGSELNEMYYLQTQSSDVNYAYPFSKIRVNGTQYMDESTWHIEMHHGVWIDIFPYDNFPDDKIASILHTYALRYFMDSYCVLCGYGSSRGVFYQIFRIFASLPLRFFGKKLSLRAMIYEITRYNKVRTEYVTMSMSMPKYSRFFCKREDFFNIQFIMFEGHHFPIPAVSHPILSRMYGDDYMQYPPVDQRHPIHNPIVFDLGNQDV
nr:LicD family protein [Methanocorpusculum petauri]